MDVVSRNRLMLFSGSQNRELAEEVSDLLGVSLGGLESHKFANDEIYARPTESVRGASCFVMQSHTRPINDAIMEQLIIIDALRRASARRITAVMPFYGYARQDKKVMPREPITARLVGPMGSTTCSITILAPYCLARLRAWRKTGRVCSPRSYSASARAAITESGSNRASTKIPTPAPARIARAGLGSAPIANAAAETDSPVRQVTIGMLGTFIDTIILDSKPRRRRRRRFFPKM